MFEFPQVCPPAAAAVATTTAATPATPPPPWRTNQATHDDEAKLCKLLQSALPEHVATLIATNRTSTDTICINDRGKRHLLAWIPSWHALALDELL